MPVMNIVTRPNAFCGHCKDEVVITDSLACPKCGEDVDTLSLTREMRERLVPEPVAPPPALLTLAGERRPSVQREIPDPVKVRVEARPEQQPERLSLPNIPSVVAWYAGTQDTRDVLAEREAQLVAELRGVRQSLKLIDAVLGRIEPPLPDMATVTETLPPVAAPLLPPSVEVQPESARPSGRIALGPAHPDYVPPEGQRKRWSEAHAACVDCGKADRPHMAKGRCRGCYGPWIKAGRPH